MQVNSEEQRCNSGIHSGKKETDSERHERQGGVWEGRGA